MSLLCSCGLSFYRYVQIITSEGPCLKAHISVIYGLFNLKFKNIFKIIKLIPIRCIQSLLNTSYCNTGNNKTETESTIEIYIDCIQCDLLLRLQWCL